jgi:hypothetical protein
MPLNLDARNWSGLWVLTNLALDAPVVDDAVPLDDVAAPLVDDLFISLDLLASGVDGLDAAGGVALGLGEDGLGDDWAIAPDSAKALSATPNMSLFNILASKR